MATDISKYKLNHTMLRVKDPEASIKFYSLLNLSVLAKLPQSSFDLYFLATPAASGVGSHFTGRQGILELTHNHGSETDPAFKINNGNAEPFRGFGHVCVSVDNLQAACKRLEDNGVKFQKKLSDGRMRNVAFALDPDGYWVEIIGQNNYLETEDVDVTDVKSYRFNHSMIRVKDAEASLKFYQEVLGLSLIRTAEMKEASFNLYFLAYAPDSTDATQIKKEEDNQAYRESILELTWNYGTEKDPNFKYHSGNDEPKGFGHLGISVDDLDVACKRFEEKGVTFKKKVGEGSMKDLAFIYDPDGYWIEVIQNENIKKRASFWDDAVLF